MVTSLKNIKTEVDNRLAAGGLDDLACCQLQNAQTILNSCVVTSVANTASLPSPALNEGRFIYVDDINEYRFSNGAFWSEDFTTVVAPYTRQIWSWGPNTCGRIGDGTITNSCSPVREASSSVDWCQVSSNLLGSSGIHTSAVNTSGQLWAWGTNSSGQLGSGVGSGSNQLTPVREFCSATNWCGTCSSLRFNLAIKTDGTIWAWGCNNCGQLGDGTLTSRCSPVRERSSSTNWCTISAGTYRSNAIKTSGELWAWGNNTCGSLGNGTTVHTCSPVREFYSATDWCQASAGREHMSAVKTGGTLWSWGQNYCGELGIATTNRACSPVREACSATDWCFVSAGRCMTAAIKTTGQLFSWGAGRYGLIAINNVNSQLTPVREITSSTNWCSVFSNSYFSRHALKTDGSLWGWGYNGNGTLGDGTQTHRSSPSREACFATDWCFVSGSSGIRITNKGFNEA